MTRFKSVHALFVEGATLDLVDNRLVGRITCKIEGGSLYIFPVEEDDWVCIEEPVFILSSNVSHILVSSGSLNIHENNILDNILQLTVVRGGRVNLASSDVFKILNVLCEYDSHVDISSIESSYFGLCCDESSTAIYNVKYKRTNIKASLRLKNET